MHKTQHRRSRVSIYTNCKEGEVDLGDDDGDVVEDSDEETPPRAKGEFVVMVMSIPLGGGHRAT
jgi:hypothetical protein